MEQLAPLGVFLGFQLLEFVEIQRRNNKLSIAQTFLLRVKVFAPFLVFLAAVVAYLLSVGYFGPLTARVRGLFVKHTRTGNPLVDSVAEHQPASESAYKQNLHETLYALVPYGFALSCVNWVLTQVRGRCICTAYSRTFFWKMYLLVQGPSQSNDIHSV